MTDDFLIHYIFLKFNHTSKLTYHSLSKPKLNKRITKIMKTELFAIILTVTLKCQDMVISKPFPHAIQITRKENVHICKYIHIMIQRNLETTVFICYVHVTGESTL